MTGRIESNPRVLAPQGNSLPHFQHPRHISAPVDSMASLNEPSCLKQIYQFIMSKIYEIASFFKHLFSRSSSNEIQPSHPGPNSISISAPINPPSVISTPHLLNPAMSRPVFLRTLQEIRELAKEGYITFYKAAETPKTAFLGNFHPCPVDMWGLRFLNSEAAFQAAKFRHRADGQEIMQGFTYVSGDQAWRLAKSIPRSNAEKTAWESESLDIMRAVVFAKFSQNIQLKECLLATGPTYLAEDIPVKGRDDFWGNDHDGTGKNWLGVIVSETRAKLGGAGPQLRPQQYNTFLAHGR